jgi:hypothetical protein
MKTENNKSKYDQLGDFIKTNKTATVIIKVVIAAVCIYCASMLFKLMGMFFKNFNDMKFAYNGRTHF